MSTSSGEPVDVKEDADGSAEATALSAKGKPAATSPSSGKMETSSLNINELREQLSAATNPDAVVKATDAIGRLRGQGRAALPCSS